MPRNRTVLVVATASAAVFALCAAGIVAWVSAEVDSAFWAAYPAAADVDAEQLLESPGLEEVEDASRAMTAEIRDAISAEYPVVWNVGGTDHTTGTANGYGGDSLLLRWSSPTSWGVIEATDAGARARISAIVAEVAGRYNAEASLANDAGDRDPSTWFGSGLREQQPAWESSVAGGLHPSYQLGAAVFDNAYPVGSDYVGWLPPSAEGDGLDTPTISIGLQASAIGMLPAADRAEFAERLAPYTGRTKPAEER